MTGIACSLVGLIGGLMVADRALPPPIDGVAVSAIVTDADELPLRVFPVEDGRWRMAANLEDIDPRFIEALLLLEDKRFFDHGGTDLLAVARAARDNLLQGRIVSGASTITMQTARLLEPRPRTLPSKLIEALRAWQLERRLSKTEILELYLTLAPYGGNLEGVRTAAWAYFGTDTEELSDSDIALLLALPQSPEVRRPDLHPANALAARATVLERLAAEGWTSPERAAEAADDFLATNRQTFPSDAWHLADKVMRQSPNHPHTNIDRRIQEQVQGLLKRTTEAAGPSVQASAMVVRLEDRAVVASVGSASRGKPGGWLDLTARRRSPGSTLKPLIYALAMQEGLVSPT
ncbi:MAG: transglycosylase domain-containing protein, partial [Parvularculaceae bacterium]|nr:transglycosylase domain-containing protein [Parvularculaceae bacterium]